MNIPINILYVDDEYVNLQLFSINLSKKYNILTAQDGIQALKLLDTAKKIDIIFSDMRMPKMDGLEFIKNAKYKLPNANYYLLTAFDADNEIRSAIQSGIIEKCFHKPFNMVEIESEIEKVSALSD